MSGLATLTTAELLCAVAAFTVAVVLVLIKLFKKEDYKSGTRSRSDHYSSRHQRKPEMDEEPAPAEVPAQVEESVEGTGAPIWYPLWLFGHEEAEKWLLPPRRDAGPPAILIDLSDPHNQGSEEGRAWIADSGAFLIAEEIWMTTDIRIAAESAYFRAAGINNGLTATELGLSFLLPRAIGSSRAFEIMLSGRDVSSREADEIGLVSRTVADEKLMESALDLADQINGWSTQGVQLTKRMMWSGLETASLSAAVELESHTQLFVRMTTQNFEEAVLARKEGRKPHFED